MLAHFGDITQSLCTSSPSRSSSSKSSFGSPKSTMVHLLKLPVTYPTMWSRRSKSLCSGSSRSPNLPKTKIYPQAASHPTTDEARCFLITLAKISWKKMFPLLKKKVRPNSWIRRCMDLIFLNGGVSLLASCAIFAYTKLVYEMACQSDALKVIE